MEYKKKFFQERKELLSYFVKFSEDWSILLKESFKDCIIKGLNRRPIIMITHDKSIFSANNRCWKV